MSNRVFHAVAAGSAIALLLSSSSLAQVDYRVDQSAGGRAGRALDANPAVGGSGLNQPAGRVDAGRYSNAVISGNVTGLAGFRGFSPVLQNNQFRATLPSADLVPFQAASVGVNDVWANRTLSSTPYYDVPRTISDVGFIRAGLNAPGSSELVTPYILPPSAAARPHPGNVVPQIDVTDRREDTELNMSKLGLIQQQPLSSAPPVSAGQNQLDSRYRATMESAIFGMPPQAALRTPAQAGNQGPWTRLEQRPPGSPIGGPTVQNEPGGAIAGEATTVFQADQPGAADSLGVHQTRIGEGQPEAAPGDKGETGETRPLGTSMENLRELGQDRFTDLFGAIETAQRLGIKKLGFQLGQIEGAAEPAGPSTAQPTPEAAQPKKQPARALRRASTEGIEQLATAAKWAGTLLEDPLTSFAGRYRDKANQYLSAGEEALRKGEYYRAADWFDLAHDMAPNNPLPLLHRGHAQLAAGDYLSASASLQQGIAKFPQIAAFRLDLPAMGGSKGIFDVRRADLEKKLESADSYDLRFLLGYLELYSGLPEEGIHDLELAASKAPPDSVIAIFVDLLTGRKELPPVQEPSAGIRP